MKRSKPGQFSRKTVVGLAVLATGMTFLSIPSCSGVLTTFNPCGTVFAFCEPYEIDALFGDVPDWSLDPTCSVPFWGLDGNNAAGTCGTTLVYTQTPGPRPDGQP